MKNYLNIIQALAENRGVQHILDMITELVDSETQAISSICLVDQARGVLMSSSSHQLPHFYNEAINGLIVAENTGSCGHAAATGEVTIVHDLYDHENWAKLKDLIIKADLRSCWSQPIVASTGMILGTFAIYQRIPHSPSEEEKNLLFSMAHLASIALERQVEIDKLVETEGLFKKVFQQSSDGMLILRDRKIINANESILQILGYDKLCDIIGLVPDQSELSPEYQPCGTLSTSKRKQIQQEMMLNENNRFEWQHRKKNGELIMVEVCATEVTIDNHKHTLGTICDISKRKKIEEHLQLAVQNAKTSSNAKSNFLAMMSHEIRTPMNGIIGFTQLLKQSSLSEEQESFLNPILTVVNHSW
jgi:two-component system, sensor histidine kinase